MGLDQDLPKGKGIASQQKLLEVFIRIKRAQRGEKEEKKVQHVVRTMTRIQG
jgi:hypothetical protein